MTEAFILVTVTSSTKLTCFWQKYQESLKIVIYPLHQLLIRLGCLEIHIALFQIPTSMLESTFVVIA